MSETPNPAPKGRRFTVGGEASADPAPERHRPRGVQDALRLSNPAEVELDESKLIYPPDRMLAFIEGQITLGELEGITKQEQYKMAERGYDFLEAGKMEEAKTVFEGLLALDPYDAYFHLVRGSIRQREGELDAAEEAYSRSIDVNAFNASAFANRGEVRVLQGQLVEGAEDLLKALELDPDGSHPATQRARATLNALQEKLAELQPGDPAPSEPPAPTAPKAAAGPKPPAPDGARPGPGRKGRTNHPKRS